MNCEKLNIKECEHKNIIVVHYANEETKCIGCKVRCIECDEILFKTKGKEKELAYKYIEENKDKFNTLDDWTCDGLNKRFDIKEVKY